MDWIRTLLNIGKRHRSWAGAIGVACAGALACVVAAVTIGLCGSADDVIPV